MNHLIFAVVALAAMSYARPDEGDPYDPKYDGFNVDEVVNNKRLLKAYAHCFIGDGNCTPDGKNFKRWIPDAVKTDCVKCSPKQKVIIAKVVKAMMSSLPQEWEKLSAVYDPEKKRVDELNAFVKEYAP